MSDIEATCIVCDDVRKEANGKHILIGVYSDVIVIHREDWERLDAGKARLLGLSFVTLLNGVPEGEYELTWWLEDPDSELFVVDKKQKGAITITPDPTVVVIRLAPTVDFTKVGMYSFRLEIGETVDFRKRFELRVQD